MYNGTQTSEWIIVNWTISLSPFFLPPSLCTSPIPSFFPSFVLSLPIDCRSLQPCKHANKIKFATSYFYLNSSSCANFIQCSKLKVTCKFR